MNEIMNINGIECYEKEGTAYLKLETVAKGLGFTQEKNGVKYVKWERVNFYLSELGFSPEVGKKDFIPENIFYRLAMKAKNETAEAFQAKVADEIIPSIRKHGAYMTDVTIDRMIASPEFGIQLLTALKEEQSKRFALEIENNRQKQLIGELKPKADYVDMILKNKGLVTITQISKDYGMSGRAFNKLLHELGVQYCQSGQWLLYSKYHHCGYTHSETINFVHSDGRPDVKMQTKWTQKGRLFLYELLKDNGYLPVIERCMAG